MNLAKNIYFVLDQTRKIHRLFTLIFPFLYSFKNSFKKEAYY